ncbi:hypothetical protein EST38_g6788 [Candolleomyces aberdarensis]|uniref:Cytochrome P450 n=1 Tax=Candolleomyces aberdarensis TaxID=2316362 RepID=A0A4Q2DGR7_9AGAR|nr:hypothetical protein EST38_g6788 [Candolleomyces aberdarensis]
MKPILVLACGLGVALAVRGIIVSRRRKRNPRRLPLPPGPRGLPLVGNLFQIPQKLPWEGYDKLCKEHGDIVYLSVFGQGVLVLGSQRRATDLLAKRGVKYSDRPVFPVADLMRFNWAMSIIPYGHQWRQQRQAFDQYLGHNAVQQYYPLMYEERLGLLRQLKAEPNQFMEHLLQAFGVTIMRIAYGFEDAQKNQSLIHEVERLILAFADAVAPGKYLVSSFPILKHIPSWFPGAGFKRHFQALGKKLEMAVWSPFEDAKQNFQLGKRSGHPSIAAGLIDALPEEGQPNRFELEELARHVCGAAYFGGYETTSVSAACFFLALANHPEVQMKAQEEIDTVIGPDRLPLLTDREALPAIMHDPEVFENPFDFNPERYLKDGKIDRSVPDADFAAFGYGRRICPGRQFSNDGLFVIVSSILSVFSVSAPKDEVGNPVYPKLEIKNPSIATLVPFKCDITPRPGREALLKD